MSLPVVAVASDHGGFDLKTVPAAELDRLGCPALDSATDSHESRDCPGYAGRVTAAVDAGRAALGFLVCDTGRRHELAANRFPTVRAALRRCRTRGQAPGRATNGRG